MSIAFIDLQAQRRRLNGRIEAAVMAAVESGAYVMGPQVREFETMLAEFGQARHALSCANGTEALVLPLMAWGIRPGDAVFVPSFTFCATVEIVPWLGATPVFIDIDPKTYNMDPAHLEAAIEATIAEGRLKPRVVIAVDLFGQPADYPAIKAVCDRHGLKLIADSAQGFGCTLEGGAHPLKWADVTTTSFFPAKPLGCYGDGGAVLTDDEDLAQEIDSYRVHGKAVAKDLAGRSFDHDPKYLNMRVGMNSRMDTLQAAVLLQKLSIFADEIEARNRVAARYAEGLSDVVVTPRVIEGGVSVWAQYTIEAGERDGLAAHLRAEGIPTAVYYPVPLHQQPPYRSYPQPLGLPVTEAKAGRVVSLPMHAYLQPDVQDRIVTAVRTFVKRNS
jgi:UDP-2-acetamido-2-deoxy-ribo-hexuluronate aminotransferase